MKAVMERKKLGELTWVDLAARDLDGQTRFYEALFGWSHDDIPTDVGPIYRMFSIDDRRVAGASQMSPEMESSGMPSMWNVYVATDDVDAIVERAIQLGGRIAMPAMDVMTEGRMVAIQDPTGAPLFFWQARDHHGAQVFGEPGSLIWAEMGTRDVETAAAFYRNLLDWEIERQANSPSPYWTASVDGEAEIGLMPIPDGLPANMPAFWQPYFAVEDVAGVVAKARTLGATVLAEPMDVGTMAFAVLSDPTGASVGIMTAMDQS